jgi:hypothetical protein
VFDHLRSSDLRLLGLCAIVRCTLYVVHCTLYIVRTIPSNSLPPGLGNFRKRPTSWTSYRGGGVVVLVFGMGSFHGPFFFWCGCERFALALPLQALCSCSACGHSSDFTLENQDDSQEKEPRPQQARQRPRQESQVGPHNSACRGS